MKAVSSLTTRYKALPWVPLWVALWTIAQTGCTLGDPASTGRAAQKSHSAVSLRIQSIEFLGTFNDIPYAQAEVQLEGDASGGEYSVPLTIAFPLFPWLANGAALVDLVNTATFYGPTPVEPQLINEARLILGEDYIFGQGNVYVSVLWDKNILEGQGLGFLAQHRDAYDVLRDVAALLRDPWTTMGKGAYGAANPATRALFFTSLSKVVAFGYSQSGSVLRDFFANHENSSFAFDAGFLGEPLGICVGQADMSDVFPCPGILDDNGKLMVVGTETSELGGWSERGQTDNYRVYELAGVSHINVPHLDLRHVNPDQNPIDMAPGFRAAHTNLLQWIDGVEPPSSQYVISQDVEPEGPYLPSERDEDGNALGGVRLPHMPSVVNGNAAGAPLGTYGGVVLSSDDQYIQISGSFFPFSDAELSERYPTHEVYVDLVEQAASSLLDQRFILEADYHEYVAEAEASNIGE